MKKIIKASYKDTPPQGPADKWYFGKEAAEKYGDLIADKELGMNISKRKDKAEEPGGLIYEANKLGIDMWDLLEALEGMCRDGRATEIDDSTYRINGNDLRHDVMLSQKVTCSEDGWEKSYMSDIPEILDELQNISYEIENCVRGAYSHCNTYSELGDKLNYLGERLSNAAIELTEMEDPEYDDVEESVNVTASEDEYNDAFLRYKDAYDKVRQLYKDLEAAQAEYDGSSEAANQISNIRRQLKEANKVLKERREAM